MIRVILLALCVLPGIALAQDEARLLRFPTIHQDSLVFCYAGDLFTVSAKGGIARRLTTDVGYEMFPRFSPDGKQIAFTAQYDGNTEIYVIPAEGGVPKRLTYTATLGRDDLSDRMGPNNICMGWTPDGKYVLFRSRMDSFNDFIGKLYRVKATGGLAEELPVPRGGFCSFSADGKKMAYNRVFREFRTWKRYKGGMADEIWVHDFQTKQTTALTKDPAQDIIPMWHEDKIYFLSERSGRMNLYSVPATGGKEEKLTSFTDYDIKFPSLGDEAIVFENAGFIWKFDLKTKKYAKITIRILEDLIGARTKLHNCAKEVFGYEISPDGSKALFGARGELFTVPVKTGATKNLTQTSGVHERNAKWSPDGKSIAYVSDVSGEDEIWIRPADGKGTPTQLTSKADTYKYEIFFSPDSKKILWTDKKLRVSIVDIASKKVTEVVQTKVWEIRDAVWSPDSKWISFSQQHTDGMSRVYLYSLANGKITPVTEERWASNSPCFSGDGKYLYFISSRDFNPIYSSTEWNHAYRDMQRIYFLSLSGDTPSPLKPADEDEPSKKESEKKESEKKESEKKEPAKKESEKKESEKKESEKKEIEIKVSLEGIQDRILQLPVRAGNYGNLVSVGSSIYYVRGSASDPKPTFAVYDFSTRKETVLGSVNGYEISANGKKMIVSQDGKYGIIDLPKGPVTISEPLNLSGMEMMLDRRAEWKQIFDECWRQMRDFFYDPGLHGVDWVGMKARYAPLVAHVSHRADLTYIIGEMIGELNAGHAYVGGGDYPKPNRIPLGQLGAKLAKDEKTGYVRIVKIYKGLRWDPSLRSPLNEAGSKVKDGDYIISIDDKATNTLDNIYSELVNKVGKSVTLMINNTPSEQGARKVVVEPIASEADLTYHDWVETNLAKVTKATGGQVGYLHVPDMLQTGLNQFAKSFYPQVGKKALIIDMRGNGGGNVSPMLIERLRREIAMFTISRNTVPRPDPVSMVYGPMNCLLNEFSASDGDLFPYRFRQHKLGKLIGKRSWGGVVGIRGTLPLTDGGTLNRPEFSRYGTDGKDWIIEGYGVDPDIEVDNDPAKEYAGEDQQLNRAIEEIMKELKEGEAKGKWKFPPPPPSPKR